MIAKPNLKWTNLILDGFEAPGPRPGFNDLYLATKLSAYYPDADIQDLLPFVHAWKRRTARKRHKARLKLKLKLVLNATRLRT